MSNVLTGRDTASRTRFKEPDEYKVVFFNDDYTPMDFVVFVLCNIFNHSIESANKIMMQVHEDGKGVAGKYPHEIAEQKAYETSELARANKHPLKVRVEQ